MAFPPAGPALVGVQIAMLGEVAERHGVTGGNALRWCISEGLVEKTGVDEFRITDVGQDAIRQHMLDHVDPLAGGATVGLPSWQRAEAIVRRESPNIVVARTVAEARRLGQR